MYFKGLSSWSAERLHLTFWTLFEVFSRYSHKSHIPSWGFIYFRRYPLGPPKGVLVQVISILMYFKGLSAQIAEGAIQVIQRIHNSKNS